MREGASARSAGWPSCSGTRPNARSDKIAWLEIGHLRPGQWRELSAKEVRRLKTGEPA